MPCACRSVQATREALQAGKQVALSLANEKASPPTRKSSSSDLSCTGFALLLGDVFLAIARPPRMPTLVDALLG